MKKYLKVPAIVMGLSVLFCVCFSGCGNTRTIKIDPEEFVVSEEEKADTEASEETQISESEEAQDQEASTENSEGTEMAEEPERELTPAEEIISKMSIEEKIWQLFVVQPQQITNKDCVTFVPEGFKDDFMECPVGGFMFYGNNVDAGPEKLKDMTSTLIDLGYDVEGLPLFMCIDEEGGRVARIGCRDAYNVPHVGPMGEVFTEDEAYDAGKTIGEYLKEYGFNLDMAPCADVLTFESNTAIGDRSFGSDPEFVSKCSAEFSKGLHESGILSTYKHFPGHGGSFGDTHDGFIFTYKTLEEMMEDDLVPFANNEEADCIMVAHISAPAITGDETPASLSYTMITEVLRNKLGYDGLVMTDALNMGAIVDFGTQEDVAVMAVLAGVDLIVVPANVDKAYNGIYQAVQNGIITEERLNESLLRIINAKLKVV